MFPQIYNEAAEAEATGLTQICGAGYRKALEFLVKDYLINIKNKEASEIRKTKLGKCIADHLGETNIATCAKRASWLGNDETHYRRKWNDHDLGDLKTLIDLTVHWIYQDILTAKYKGRMTPQIA